jgi:hypothetical protein
VHLRSDGKIMPFARIPVISGWPWLGKQIPALNFCTALTASLIPIKDLARNCHIFLDMTETKKTDRDSSLAHTVDRNPVSAVRLPIAVTANIDVWARNRAITRSEAIRRLIELGLKADSKAGAARTMRREPADIETLAVTQIDQLIDPETPREERDRRIHRLTEGPPEFVGIRVDLPKREH